MKVVKQLGFFLRKNIVNIKILIPILILVIFSYMSCAEYNNIAASMQTNMNVLEPAIFLLGTGKYMAALFGLCAMFALCDVPFADGVLPYYVSRLGKVRWYFSLLPFMLMLSVIIVLIPILVSLIVCGGAGFFSISMWSGTAVVTSGDTTSAAIFAPEINAIFFNYTPGQALLHACLLNLIHFLMIGIILLTLNSIKRKTYGIGLVGLLEVGGFITAASFPQFGKFLPFLNASLEMHSLPGAEKFVDWNRSRIPYLWESYIYFVVATVVFLIVGYFAIRRYRFELGEAK